VTAQQLLIPVRANWTRPVRQTYEFRTDPMEAQTGHETRRRYRSTPRVALEFDAMLVRTPFRNLERYWMNRIDELGYVGNPVEFVTTLSALNAGDDDMAVDDIPYWLENDAFVIIGYGDYMELFEVAGIIAPNVTMKVISTNDWPAGSRLYKAEKVRVDRAQQSFSMLTRATAVVPMKLRVDPVSTILPTVGAVGSTFDSRELFEKRPNLADEIDLEITSGLESVDYGFGTVATFSPKLIVSRDYRATFVGRTQVEVQETVDFFRRMYGRQKEFYAPTGLADLLPISNLTVGTAVLTVAGTLDYEMMNDTTVANSSLVNRAVWLTLRDGTTIQKKINSVTTSGGNTRFNMTTNWSSTITPAQIAYVSYLPLCRFGTDMLEVEWLTASVAQYDLVFHTLEALDAE